MSISACGEHSGEPPRSCQRASREYSSGTCWRGVPLLSAYRILQIWRSVQTLDQSWKEVAFFFYCTVRWDLQDLQFRSTLQSKKRVGCGCPSGLPRGSAMFCLFLVDLKPFSSPLKGFQTPSPGLSIAQTPQMPKTRFECPKLGLMTSTSQVGVCCTKDMLYGLYGSSPPSKPEDFFMKIQLKGDLHLYEWLLSCECSLA